MKIIELNQLECDTCLHMESKLCQECKDKNKAISIHDMKQMLLECQNTLSYRRKVSRSWGDCRPDEEAVEFNHISIHKVNLKIKEI